MHRAAVFGVGALVGGLVLQAARPGRAEVEPVGRVALLGPPVAGDADEDGLVDANELELAGAYFPYFSLAPNDACARHGVVFRLTPHPQDRSKIVIWYGVLYETDCGFDSHLGDNEMFSALVDPALPAPEGILALRAVSHMDTVCEHTSTCGTLPGCAPCDLAMKEGKPYPVVYASRDKHGGYVDARACAKSLVCDFGGCVKNPVPDAPALVNAGEPGRPLVENLTTHGFIRPENGWHERELFDYEPWGGVRFGEVGGLAEDLTDPRFLISPSSC